MQRPNSLDSSLPRVLVAIPTLNEAAHIEATIEALNIGLEGEQSVLFVVADGGSVDGTADIVEKIAKQRPNVHLIANPDRLQSAGINRAVDAFGNMADVLIRCDAHSQYPHNYVVSLLHTLRESAADSVVVPMDTIGTNCLQKAIAWVSNSPIGSGGSAHRAGRRSSFVDHGHHAAIWINSFIAIGGYDSTFSHNEDAELDCRLLRSGGRIFLTSETRIGYYPRDSITSLAIQYFNYGRGRSRTVRRHPGSMRLRQAAVPIHFLIFVLSFLACLAISPAFLIYPIAYVFGLMIGATIIACQNFSFCGFLAAPAAFVMHMAWACGFFVGLLTTHETAWRPSGRRLDTPGVIGERT